jgi:hypothetical protein
MHVLFLEVKFLDYPATAYPQKALPRRACRCGLVDFANIRRAKVCSYDRCEGAKLPTVTLRQMAVFAPVQSAGL